MVVAGGPGDQALHNPPPAYNRVRIHVDAAPALVSIISTVQVEISTVSDE